MANRKRRKNALKWSKHFAMFGAALLPGLAFTQHAKGQSYTVTRLGSLGGTTSDGGYKTHVTGINASGQVVGSDLIPDGSVSHAFLFDGTTMRDLGTLYGDPFANSEATGINANGQVSGWSEASIKVADNVSTPGYELIHYDWVQRGFLYTGSSMLDLGTFTDGIGSTPHSAAYAINDNGVVVGIAGNRRHAVDQPWQIPFRRSGTDMGGLGYINSSGLDIATLNPFAINNAGQIAGIIEGHPFVYDGSTMHVLGNLSDGNPWFDGAFSINASGQAVGALHGRAFLYDEEGMHDLAPLGKRFSKAYSINSSGQIVGTADDDDYTGFSFLYENGRSVDVNDLLDPQLGWRSSFDAQAINDSGQIAGIAGNDDGYFGVVLLTPGFRWQNLDGGWFNAPENWRTSVRPPGSADSAIFDLPNTYHGPVAFTENTSTRTLTVSKGQLTFDLRGYTYDVSDSAKIVGEDTLLQIQNGKLALGDMLKHDSVTIEGALEVVHDTSAERPAQLELRSSNPVLIKGKLKLTTVAGQVVTQPMVTAVNGLDVADTGSIVGSGHIKANLQSAGHIDLSKTSGAVRTTFTRAVVDATGTTQTIHVDGASQMLVDGDFTQTHAGKMSIELRENLRVPTTGAPTFAFAVTGKAKLDGTLELTRAANFRPEVGDRFNLMSYDSLEGRFTTFKGSVLKDESGDNFIDDRFIGLDYRKDHLEAITLETPRALLGDGIVTTTLSPKNGPRNLILATHGTNSNPDVWATALVAGISQQMSSSTKKTWDVATFDWSRFAGDITSFADGAVETARVGSEIGESLASWMKERGLSYQQVHLLGHSSGAWVVDGLADKLKDQGNQSGSHPFIHETLFDANAVPVGKSTRSASEWQLADSANYADHYVDNRSLTFIPVGLDYTNETLAAFNIDITALDGRGIFGSAPVKGPHGWPYGYYTLTVDDSSLLSAYFGARHSSELGLTQPSYKDKFGSLKFAQGGRVFLAPGPGNTAGVFAGSPQFGANLLQDPHTELINSDTGTVTVTAANELAMTTGSPVFSTVIFTLDHAANLMQFNYQFTGDADGLFSVFFGGSEIFEAQKSFTTEGLWTAGPLWLGDTLVPGTYSVLFRLDPLTESHSSILVSNLQFALASPVSGASVPEPSTVLVLVGTVGLLAFRRGSRKPDAIATA